MRRTTAIFAALGVTLLAGHRTTRTRFARVVGRVRRGRTGASTRGPRLSAATLLARRDLSFVPQPRYPIG